MPGCFTAQLSPLVPGTRHRIIERRRGANPNPEQISLPNIPTTLARTRRRVLRSPAPRRGGALFVLKGRESAAQMGSGRTHIVLGARSRDDRANRPFDPRTVHAPNRPLIHVAVENLSETSLPRPFIVALTRRFDARQKSLIWNRNWLVYMRTNRAECLEL